MGSNKRIILRSRIIKNIDATKTINNDKNTVDDYGN